MSVPLSSLAGEVHHSNELEETCGLDLAQESADLEISAAGFALLFKSESVHFMHTFEYDNERDSWASLNARKTKGNSRLVYKW